MLVTGRACRLTIPHPVGRRSNGAVSCVRQSSRGPAPVLRGDASIETQDVSLGLRGFQFTNI